MNLEQTPNHLNLAREFVVHIEPDIVYFFVQ